MKMRAIEQAEQAMREATAHREGFKGAVGIWSDQCAARVQDAFLARESDVAEAGLVKLALLNWVQFRTG
jgi:hypothetical protein